MQIRKVVIRRDRWEAGLPKISIVTPSYQQGNFIQETIDSVLAQEYPNFEHIVMDGGSTDETIEVLRHYPHLCWKSERDEGQTHAINKGMLLATGDILAYLNSDDVYRPGAFHAVARFFQENPEARIVVGDCDYINERSEVTGHLKARFLKIEDLIRYWGWDKWFCIPQQSVFFRRDVLDEVGLFNTSFHMVMDYEMWLRIAQRMHIHTLPRTLAGFRLAPNTKTTSKTHLMYREELAASREFWGILPLRRRAGVAIEAYRHLSGKLLDVAEHYCFNDLQPQLVASLLTDSLRSWPASVFYPRMIFSIAQYVTPGGGKALIRKAHRSYLGLKWRIREARQRRNS